MKTPIHSINIDVHTYAEAKELFDYATRKASKTNSSFGYTSVINHLKQ
ncbi:hypothetical protein [Vibrio chagasii]|nr:hypothetical protein [Vibrio chagasii]